MVNSVGVSTMGPCAGFSGDGDPIRTASADRGPAKFQVAPLSQAPDLVENVLANIVERLQLAQLALV